MLVIRLTRTGKVHSPHYRIVVQEKRSKLNGKALAILGHYHPAQADKQLVVDKEQAEKYLQQGAQPSETVNNLLVKAGVLDKSKKISLHFTPKPKEQAAAPAPAAKETAEEGVEAAVATADEAAAEPGEEAAGETAEEEPAAEPAAEAVPEPTGEATPEESA